MKTAREILGDELYYKIAHSIPDDRPNYPDGFWHWLCCNAHIWHAFEEKAYVMAAVAKRKKYSARTIIEVIRWKTDLHDSEKTFKINDHYTPGLARLWMAKHGKDFPKFFELRGTQPWAK